jgi:hypothetical protein
MGSREKRLARSRRQASESNKYAVRLAQAGGYCGAQPLQFKIFEL